MKADVPSAATLIWMQAPNKNGTYNGSIMESAPVPLPARRAAWVGTLPLAEPPRARETPSSAVAPSLGWLPRPASLRAPRGSFAAASLKGGADALGVWIDARAKALEVVAQQRDADGQMVDSALALVRRFIVERGLILFGGLAIDYALRLKGEQLYPDGERPDFDVLSPNSVLDAYDLADLLQAAGFEGVGAVRAIHVQTMKVRTDFVWVADIGYAPRDVFDALPTLDYLGMRIIHPDFQRMDQHLAFCFPFNGPPREDVFHRWRKDLKRFNLFERLYPIRAADEPRARPVPTRRATGTLQVPFSDAAAEKLSVACHGFAAYALLRAAYDGLVAAGPAVSSPPLLAPTLAIDFSDARSVSVEVPAALGDGPLVVVASPEPAAAVAGLEATWYDPFMDVCPAAVVAGGVRVLSTKGRLLAASALPAPGLPGKVVRVVSPQYLLLYFLYEAHVARDAATRTVYKSFYCHTLALLAAAEQLFVARRAASAPSNQVEALFAASPFAPTTQTIGSVNTDAAYIIKMARYAEMLKDSPPDVLNLEPSIASLLEGLPANYYPATAKQRPSFIYEACHLFDRSGRASHVAP